MGVLHGRDLLSSRHTTAIIWDASNRLYFVPIKYSLGDYFPVVINNLLYVFKIEGSRILTYRETLSKAFRVLIYTTSHFLPISAEQKELELVLHENNLPRVEGNLYSIMKILGKKEKDPFQPHNIKELLEEVAQKEDEYSVETRNLITFLDHLKVDRIVTPVRRLSDFLDGELLETDPKFYGTVTALQERTDKGNKMITNAPMGPKIAWMKWIAVMALVGLVLAVVYMAYDNGWFDPILNAGKSLEGFQGINFGGTPGSTDAEFAQKYPTPEAAKAALDRGELHESQIPPAMRELVKNVKTPEAIPTP